MTAVSSTAMEEILASHFLSNLLWSDITAKFRFSGRFFLLFKTFRFGFLAWIEGFYMSHSLGQIPVVAYIICLYGQYVFTCNVPSRSPFPFSPMVDCHICISTLSTFAVLLVFMQNIFLWL